MELLFTQIGPCGPARPELNPLIPEAEFCPPWGTIFMSGHQFDEYILVTTRCPSVDGIFRFYIQKAFESYIG